MKMRGNDYWLPRPGSWEEAVDPYEIQSRRARKDGRDKSSRTSFKAMSEQLPEPSPRTPVSV